MAWWRYVVGLGALGFAIAAGSSCGSEAGSAGQSTSADTAPAGSGPAAVSGGETMRMDARSTPAVMPMPMLASAGHSAPEAAMGGAAAASGSGGVPAAGANASLPPPSAGSKGQAGMPAAISGGGAGAPAAAGGSATPTVYIAGDSTVSTYEDTASPNDQAGWGQMLHERVKAGVKIENRAIGGRTARRFIDDGKLDEIWKDIREGDYLLVQFGTNDSNKDATYTKDGQTIPYYLDPETDFKTYLKRYIDGAHSHKAVPVLVTPPPRSSAYCTGGNGTGAWAQAMRELGMSSMLIVSDLNQQTVDYLKAICPAPNPPDFFLQKSDGTVDGTHFQERGARKLAEFVANGLRQAGVSWVE